MALIRRVLLPFARRFVAGETVDSAVERARELEQDGITAYIDLLGEHVEEREVAESARDEYLELLDRLDDEGIDAGLSVKPTHLGLEVDRDFCRDNLDSLVERAGESGRYVWIDMESSDHTQETIDLYLNLLPQHGNVGLCIQSYLKRTEDDVWELIEHGADLRLVKGAYDESRGVAYRRKKAVDQHFRALMELLFRKGVYVSVATHDRELVEEAKELADEHGYDREEFEFQFLMGVRHELNRELAEKGYRVGEYVPYGPEWLSYYYRRVRERKENLRFALRAVLPV